MKKRLLVLLMSLALLISPAFASEETPEAALRYDTLVVRIPRDWFMARVTDGTLTGLGDLFLDEDVIPLGKLDKVWQRVHTYRSDDALKFMTDCITDGEAESVKGMWALGYPGGYQSIMAQQYIDGAWYSIIRLSGEDDLKKGLFCDGSVFDLSMEAGMLKMTPEIFDCVAFETDVKNMNDVKPVFSSGGVRIYEVFDQLLAVVTQSGGDKDTLWSASPLVNGEKAAIVTRGTVSGYRDGDSAVFCFFITDEELDKLKQGAPIRLEYDPFQ